MTTTDSKAEVMLDAALVALDRGAHAIGITGFVLFALSAAFCAGFWAASRAMEKATGRWSR